MNNYSNISIFWIGRFLRHGGYSVATRELFKALKKLDVNVVGIDADNNLPIDDSGYEYFEFRGGGKEILTIKAKDHLRKVLVIFHELPTEWNRIKCQGSVHFIGYTVTETEQIPFRWTEQMLNADRVWTATKFNKEIFEAAGIPTGIIEVIPHAIDTTQYKAKKRILPMRNANDFRLLCMASNFNRKDLPGMVRAYCDAFSSEDNVSLIIKLPKNVNEEDLQRFIVNGVKPWYDLSNTETPHILLICDYLSDENLKDLFCSCHGFISLERGKGWDLPSIEALLLGIPTIGINWGGNTEFQNKNNSLMIEPGKEAVFSNEDLVLNKILYSGNTWATYDIADATDAIRELYSNWEKYREKAIESREALEKLVGLNPVGKKILSYLDKLNDFDYKGYGKAKFSIVTKEKIREFKLSNNNTYFYEGIEDKDRNILDKQLEACNKLKIWLAERENIWEKYINILPNTVERTKLDKLKNFYQNRSLIITNNHKLISRKILKRLKGEIIIDINNYMAPSEAEFKETDIIIIKQRTAAENVLRKIGGKNTQFIFLPHIYKGILQEHDKIFYYERLTEQQEPALDFAKSIANGVFCSESGMVEILHIAYHMGLRNLYLLGFDDLLENSTTNGDLRATHPSHKKVNRKNQSSKIQYKIDLNRLERIGRFYGIKIRTLSENTTQTIVKNINYEDFKIESEL